MPELSLRRTQLALATALALVLAAGCGGDDDPGGGAADSAVAVDADPNAPDADPNAPDANPNAPDANTGGGADSGPGNTEGIICGTMTCTGSDICCSTFGGGGATQECTAEGDCMGTPSSCDGPEDCNGASEICCGGFSGAACQQGGQCQAELCHTDGDCDGEVCCDAFGGLRICQAQCFGGP